MKQYKFKINGNDYNVAINSTNGNLADVTVNGVSYQVEMENSMPAAAPVQAAPQASAPAPQPAAAAAPAPAAKPAGEGKAVTSPLPGVIIEVSVKEGDTVAAGQKVAVLEAMKMENEIFAPASGKVIAINTTKGASVNSGDCLLVIG